MFDISLVPVRRKSCDPNNYRTGTRMPPRIPSKMKTEHVEILTIGPRKTTCLSEVFGKDCRPLTFHKEKKVGVVSDMEGEILPLILALTELNLVDLNKTKLEKDPVDGVHYFDFELSINGNCSKLLKLLGDICDRGIFGIIAIKTIEKLFEKIQMNQSVLKIEAEFTLGNHDIYYLLKIFGTVEPSICKSADDPAFEKIHKIFKSMCEKRQLQLASYDSTLNQLTTHGVFTMGEHGFLNKFEDFIKSTPRFEEHIKEKFGEKETKEFMGTLEIVNKKMCSSENFWDPIDKEKFLAKLIDYYNSLIDHEYLFDHDNGSANREDISKFLNDEVIESPIWKVGIRKNDLVAPFDQSCFPIPGVVQVNGHWSANSRDPFIEQFPPKLGGGQIIKLDHVTSSRVVNSGVAYPTILTSQPGDVSATICRLHSQRFLKSPGVNIAHYMKKLESKVNSNAINTRSKTVPIVVGPINKPSLRELLKSFRELIKQGEKSKDDSSEETSSGSSSPGTSTHSGEQLKTLNPDNSMPIQAIEYLVGLFENARYDEKNDSIIIKKQKRQELEMSISALVKEEMSLLLELMIKMIESEKSKAKKVQIRYNANFSLRILGLNRI